jgi:FeS assembly SUF system protein
MDHDPFDFDANPPAAGDDVERPEGGEDDPALMGPVLEALKTVRDPEIPMDLVELGLIYELIVKKGGIVYVEMTLTTPACPVAASMPGEVETAIRSVPGVDDVRVKLVWSPPWGPDRMSEEARLARGGRAGRARPAGPIMNRMDDRERSGAFLVSHPVPADRCRNRRDCRLTRRDRRHE